MAVDTEEKRLLYCMKCGRDTRHVLIKGEYTWHWRCEECGALK